VTTHVAIVDTLTFEVSPRQNTVTINARSHPKLLDYPSARFVAYSNQTLAAIITDICRRAGATLAALPGTSQFSQALSCFMIPPGETWLSALKRLSGIYGFNFFGTAAPAIKIVEPQPGDSSVWSYSSEILAASYGVASDQANIIRVSGSSTAGAPTPFAEAIDTANLSVIGRERYRNVVDRILDTAAKCQIRASLELRQEQRDAVHGQLICALNPQHELLDVISITDAAIGASNLQLRIESISWAADFETGVYEQQLHLCGV
jgi:prophage tail gpP-like protein